MYSIFSIKNSTQLAWWFCRFYNKLKTIIYTLEDMEKAVLFVGNIDIFSVSEQPRSEREGRL